jgi:serine/threonine-protein kinase SRK2
LIQRIFVVDAAKRIDIAGIKAHPWFLIDLPIELVDDAIAANPTNASPTSTMSIEEILAIVEEAKTPYEGAERDHHDAQMDGDHDMVTSGEFDDDDF